MLEIDVLAKKLLANEVCNNCLHSSYSMNIIRCKKYEIASFCPEEGTCEDWKKTNTSNDLIIESGSNEYGNFVKYRDGKMECWGNTIDYTIFPKDFVGIPIVSLMNSTIESITCVDFKTNNAQSSPWKATGRWYI